MTEDNTCTDIRFYGLSTCMWCKKSKALLDEKNVEYIMVFVNELDADAREKVRQEVRALNPSGSYPTIKVGDTVIVGHHPEQLEEALAACQPKMRS